MSWLAGLGAKLRETLSRSAVDAELDEEISFHIEREAERLIREGRDEGTARRLAGESFGKPRKVREQVREEYGFPTVEAVLRDLRYATRGLRRTPTFTAAAVLTIGLGIGAVTAVFSVLNGVVLRPLPYADDGEIVRISHTDNEGDRLGIPDGGYFYYRDNATTLGAVAAYLEVSEPVGGTGEPLELGMILATPSLFDVVRVTPLLGRLFTEEDAAPGAPDVTLLTYSFWVQQFGSDPDVLGQPVIPGSDVEIIGVLPPEFGFIRPDASIVFGNSFAEPQVILPLTLRQATARFGNFMYQGIARLEPGTSAGAAEAELQTLMIRASQTYTGGHTPESLREGGHRPVVVPLKEALVGRIAGTLWILFGAVGLVLLIAIANVANLFVARAGARRRELALRRSLGAGFGALARASICEGLVLSLIGGVLGVGLALAGTRVLLRLAPTDIPRVEDVGMDPVVLALAFAITVLAGLIFGLFPLLGFRSMDAGSALTDESRGATMGRDRQRTRRMLVTAQIGFALVLLVGAGLLLRTLASLRSIDPGFDPSGVLTMRVAFPDDPGPADRARRLIDLTERLEGIPGVEVATFTGDLPLDGDEWRDYVAVEGSLPANLDGGISALRVFSGPGYLAAIGATLLRGRELERRDFAGYPQYVVVNEAFAAQRWPDEDPIGKRLLQWPNEPAQDVWYTVSGIVANVHEVSLMVQPEPTIYLPTVFRPDDSFGMFVSNMPLIIRTSGEPATFFAAIESEIHAYDPEIPITAVTTLSDLQARSFQQVSFAMILILVAGGVALLLVAIGIYGVVSYLVSLRMREFGIRIALGATPARLRRAVLREGAVIAGLGIALGLVGAFALSRILRSLLFGVAATDLVTYAGVSVVLLATVLLASLGPARRATVADPVASIRAE